MLSLSTFFMWKSLVKISSSSIGLRQKRVVTCHPLPQVQYAEKWMNKQSERIRFGQQWMRSLQSHLDYPRLWLCARGDKEDEDGGGLVDDILAEDSLKKLEWSIFATPWLWRVKYLVWVRCVKCRLFDCQMQTLKRDCAVQMQLVLMGHSLLISEQSCSVFRM